MIKKILIAFSLLSYQSSIGQEIKILPVRDIYRFTATWCGPCQSLKQTVLKDQEIENSIIEYNSILTVDIDKYRHISKLYGITTIPEVIVVEESTNNKVKIIGRWKPITGFSNASRINANKQSLLSFLKNLSPIRPKNP